MPLEGPAVVVRELTDRGYNAEPEAVTLLAGHDDPAHAIERVVDAVPDDALRITADHVCEAVGDSADTARDSSADTARDSPADTATDPPSSTDTAADEHPSVSTAKDSTEPENRTRKPPSETQASEKSNPDGSDPAPASDDIVDQRRDTGQSGDGAGVKRPDPDSRPSAVESTPDPEIESPAGDRDPEPPAVDNDMTGGSTGTGEYDDFVRVFRDRYDRLRSKLESRITHRPADAIADSRAGEEVAMIGLVNDIRSTRNGHWLIELEDTTGTFPFLVAKDREITPVVDELLCDEVVAAEGTLSDDGGIAFADEIHFPDVPRGFRPTTADRDVSAALVSDIHVGSQEFVADAWEEFADWLHTSEAGDVEYLLIAGDMVEGVGVYPGQDEELSIVDIYDQYDQFSEHLKSVPGDIEVVMIPGNHDAVRLAEPQPGFDDDLREIMSAHDVRIASNPATVTVAGVSVLLYHGVSLDEVIAELPDDLASYDDPHLAMQQLLKKRHVAPQFGGQTRLAPEERDYLVIDSVPDIFHTGHVHKLGVGTFRNVLTINSGCWQAQTAFQKSVNIDPDVAYAPIVDLKTRDVTLRKFR